MDEILHSGLLPELERARERQDAAVRNDVFAHPKICAVGYAEGGEARRHIFHRRALQTLQAADASAVELAYHALAAGLAEPAFHWCIAAGDEAMQVFAYAMHSPSTSRHGILSASECMVGLLTTFLRRRLSISISTWGGHMN